MPKQPLCLTKNQPYDCLNPLILKEILCLPYFITEFFKCTTQIPQPLPDPSGNPRKFLNLVCQPGSLISVFFSLLFDPGTFLFGYSLCIFHRFYPCLRGWNFLFRNFYFRDSPFFLLPPQSVQKLTVCRDLHAQYSHRITDFRLIVIFRLNSHSTQQPGNPSLSPQKILLFFTPSLITKGAKKQAKHRQQEKCQHNPQQNQYQFYDQPKNM